MPVGEVRHPKRVGPLRLERAMDRGQRTEGALITHHRSYPLATHYATQALATHEPLDRVQRAMARPSRRSGRLVHKAKKSDKTDSIFKFGAIIE